MNAPRAGGPKPTPRPGFAPSVAAVEAEREAQEAAIRDAAPPPPAVAEPTEVAPAVAAPVADATAVAAPAPTGRRRGRRGRRVKRVVRRIDLWSVLKLSLVVYTCLYLAVLATLAALWGLAYSSGNVDKLQSFLADVGLENFTFYGNQMFRACAAIGAVGVIAGTVVTVLATALVNLISEMQGGIRLVVIEEDVAPDPTR